MCHQGFNRNLTKLREYFLYTKKTKIMTLFNNSSPPRHPIAPFWRVSTERKQCMLFCVSRSQTNTFSTFIYTLVGMEGAADTEQHTPVMSSGTIAVYGGPESIKHILNCVHDMRVSN